MHSYAQLLPLLLALSSSALAQTTVQKIFFPGPSDTDGWVGSVVNVGGDQTTYAIACTSGTDACETGVSITLTEGPTNFAIVTATATSGVTGSVSETCTIAGTTSATCVAAVSASFDGVSSVVTTTTTMGTADFHYHPITITAGAGQLSGAAATTSGNAGAPMVTGMGALGMAGLGVLALL